MSFLSSAAEWGRISSWPVEMSEVDVFWGLFSSGRGSLVSMTLVLDVFGVESESRGVRRMCGEVQIVG